MKQSFFARRGFLIIAISVFLMPLILRGTRLTIESNRNDVKDWLPDTFEETAVHSWFKEHFPHEQFVLATWEGCTLGDQRLRLMAEKLETYDPTIDHLGLEPHVVEALKAKGLRRISDLKAKRHLRGLPGVSAPESIELEQKVQAWKSPFKAPVLTGTRLVEDMQVRYPELSREQILTRLEGSLIGKDHNKTCLVVTLGEAAKGKQLRPTLEIIRDLARQSGIEPAVQPAKGNIFTRGAEASGAFLRELAFGRPPKTEGIRLGGPPVDNVAIDIEGERTLFRLAGLSLLVGVTVSYLCFRSIRLTILVIFTALLAAGTSMASVFLSGGTSDAILLTMPSLVYVLAISGAIHIINYYHDAIHEGGLEGAPSRALRYGWLPCSLAALTTSLGLGSLVVSHVIPISKFGIYSAWGVLLSLIWVFLFLPSCLNFFPSRKLAEETADKHHQEAKHESLIVRFWHNVGVFVTRRNGWVAAGSVAVMVFFALGLTQIKTSVKLMKLFSPDAEIISDYGWIEDHIGPLVPMEVIIHVDNQQNDMNMVERMRLAQYVERSIEQLSDVGGALSAATFAPDISRDQGKAGIFEKMAGIDRQRTRDRVLSKRLKRHRKEFREYLTVDREIAVAGPGSNPSVDRLGIPAELARKLEAAGIGTLQSLEQHGDPADIEGIGPEGAKRIIAAKEQWWQDHRNPTLAELDIPTPVAEKLAARGVETLTDIERLGTESTSYEAELAAQSMMTTEEAAQVAAAVDNWRTAHGEELWRVTARVAALTDLDYGVFVDRIKEKVEPVLAAYRKAGVKGIDATYTGLVPLVYKTQHELMRGLFESLATAFLLIAVVMMLVLRSPVSGLVSMVPNLFPVIVIFGIMGWTDILVDVGSMMTASVALGVAVDDTIHYLTWFRRGLDKGLDRKGAVLMAYERCATAMTQTTLIAGLGLAVFAFSTFTPTQRFGMLMLTLLAAALVGDLIFLPAMLSGPFGKLFLLKRKKPGDEPSGSAADEGKSDGEEADTDADDADDADMLTLPLDPTAEGGRRTSTPHGAHRRSRRAL